MWLVRLRICSQNGRSPKVDEALRLFVISRPVSPSLESILTGFEQLDHSNLAPISATAATYNGHHLISSLTPAPSKSAGISLDPMEGDTHADNSSMKQAIDSLRTELLDEIERSSKESSDQIARFMAEDHIRAMEEEAKKDDMIKGMCQFVVDQLEKEKGNLGSPLASNPFQEGVLSTSVEQMQRSIQLLEHSHRAQLETIDSLHQSLDDANQKLRRKDSEMRTFADEMSKLKAKDMEREGESATNMEMLWDLVVAQTDIQMRKLREDISSGNMRLGGTELGHSRSVSRSHSYAAPPNPPPLPARHPPSNSSRAANEEIEMEVNLLMQRVLDLDDRLTSMDQDLRKLTSRHAETASRGDVHDSLLDLIQEQMEDMRVAKSAMEVRMRSLELRTRTG